MGHTERVNEHPFTQDGTPTAFAGQASDTKWLQRATTELDRDPGADNTTSSKDKSAIPWTINPAATIKKRQINTEDIDMSVIGDQIYPFEFPVNGSADNFIEAYFTLIQLSFPILDWAEFISQYQEVRTTTDLAAYTDRTFIATLQLVFALGAVHAHLVNAEWAGDERDHMLYMASARLLAVDSGILNDVCSIAQVRVFALGALYLLATDQINRYTQARLSLSQTNVR